MYIRTITTKHTHFVPSHTHQREGREGGRDRGRNRGKEGGTEGKWEGGREEQRKGGME